MYQTVEKISQVNRELLDSKMDDIIKAICDDVTMSMQFLVGRGVSQAAAAK